MPTYLRYIIIIVVSSLLFFPFLGQVNLFDWDEINFAECAREMIVSKDYLRMQIDFHPFWEKPPLFIWMQVLAMKAFGVNAFAARFPNAVTGIATLCSIFYAGKRVAGEKMATWWVLLYASTLLPHLYFKSGIIDPCFNLFIFLAVFQVYLLKHGSRQLLHTLLAGVFMGLAVLTKGPVAMLVTLLAFVVYIVLNKGINGYKLWHILLIAFTALCTTAIWFGPEVLQHGTWFINEFINYQVRLFKTEDAGHGGPFFYHFIVLLTGCFPAAAFLFQYSLKRVAGANDQVRDFNRWMWILFWVVLLLFSIVKTKIIHYSSLCYFPLTYLAALQLYRLAEDKDKLKGRVKAILLFTGGLIATAIAILPAIGINRKQLVPLIQDPFVVDALDVKVNWYYAECLWGGLYLVVIFIAVSKMGKQFRQGILLLCVAQLVVIQAITIEFLPKIEAFSQRTAIDYCKSLKGQDVYIRPLDFKSYAPMFYGERRPYANPMAYDLTWLLDSPVDKPTYFICKTVYADTYKVSPRIMVIDEKNGFTLMKRKQP